jgi:hypothetical protein
MSLIGLILFFAGIYLTYWVYLDFESFNTLYLGLYLSGSFVLMTLGFYLFLLPLALKPKNSKVDISKSIEQVSTKQLNEVKTDEITEGTILLEQEDLNDIASISITNSIEQDALLENDIEEVNTITQSTDEIILEEEFIVEEKHESNQLKKDDTFETLELRVIGIESWSSQGILHKLTQDSLLEINQKIKSGITMNQICFKQKLIGYIPRLDMNKINHKLDRLIEIKPSNIVREGRKVIHFSVNITFKTEDKTNE